MILDLSLGVVCLLLLVSSAFFSGSETALFALDPHQRHALRKRHDLPARRVATLLGDLGDLLATVLVGNTFVNILLAVLATRLLIRHLGPVRGPVISGFAVTALVLLFGEILPKSVAVRGPLGFSLRVSGLLTRLCAAMRPLTHVLLRRSRGLLSWLERILPGDDLDMQTDDMFALLGLAVEEGGIGQKERELARGVLDLGQTQVQDVMTPRVDVFLLEAETAARDATLPVREAGYSLLPLYEGSPDHVVGVLSAVALLDHEDDARPVGSLATPPRFCPESQNAGALLVELLEEGERLAVVLDEYGALAGLTTLEDLYELLVGDVLDHRDYISQRFYMPDENTLVASSRMEPERVEELLGLKLVGHDVETLGGYLMAALGEVPERGRRYELGRVAWTVLSAKGPALGTVKLERLR